MNPTSPLPNIVSDRRTRKLASLRHDASGISMVEFALVLPLLVGLGMAGMEIAHLASVNMQISQIALSVADNASRLGQSDNSAVAPTVRDADVGAVLGGAMRQGESLDFEKYGRIVLSSLELDEGDPAVTSDDKQYIHWQRCAGDLDNQSSYGVENDTVTGIGRAALTANSKQAVMFAEVFYRYQPLFAGFLVDDMQFRKEAAFIVRDDRDLAGGLSGANLHPCDA
jgi:hypothetical protein